MKSILVITLILFSYVLILFGVPVPLLAAIMLVPPLIVTIAVSWITRMAIKDSRWALGLACLASVILLVGGQSALATWGFQHLAQFLSFDLLASFSGHQVLRFIPLIFGVSYWVISLPGGPPNAMIKPAFALHLDPLRWIFIFSPFWIPLVLSLIAEFAALVIAKNISYPEALSLAFSEILNSTTPSFLLIVPLGLALFLWRMAKSLDYFQLAFSAIILNLLLYTPFYFVSFTTTSSRLARPRNHGYTGDALASGFAMMFGFVLLVFGAIAIKDVAEQLKTFKIRAQVTSTFLAMLAILLIAIFWNSKEHRFSRSLPEIVATKALDDVQKAIEAGIDVNEKDSEQKSALFRAAIIGNLEMARLLLERGADPNSLDGSGASPLQAAAERGDLDMAKLLIDYGAKVDGNHAFNWTPLHAASYFGKIDVIKFLISRGADLKAKEKNAGWSVHDAAKNGKHPEVIPFLVNQPRP